MNARSETTAPPHRFGLDLLRAAAILMVVSSHAGMIGTRWFGVADPPHLAVSGFFGVEGFFVLSGFLIGRIILDTVAADPRLPTLRTFLVRRWARTLPLYYALLALLAALDPPGGGVRDVLPYFLTLTQNLAWKTREFWFPVTWSLAVEEWFYVLFPLLAMGLARRSGAVRGTAMAAAIFLVVPLAARAVLAPGLDWNDVTRQVVVLRLDAIAFGVAVALLDRSRFGAALRRHRAGLALAGALVLALQWWGGLQGSDGSARWVHDVFATDVADGGWAMLVPFLAVMRRAAAAIAVPVRLVAERSYGLYLTHLSVLGVADRGVMLHGWNRWAATAGVAAAFVVVPSLTWHGLERPILSLARRPALSPRRIADGALTPAPRPG